MRYAKSIFGLPVVGTLAALFLQPLDIAAADTALVEVAKAVWQPMHGSPPPVAVTQDGRAAMRLVCPFATTDIERASWDLKAPLDLSTAPGIRFDVLCRNPGPVSGFVIYFESGRGWYRTDFEPESADGWSTVVIDKAATGIEGKPEGWAKISTIRISAWRGKNADTEFCIGDIRPVAPDQADPLVAIVRADSAAQRLPDEAKAAAGFASDMADAFGRLDIPSVIVSDLDLAAGRLKPYKLAVLPHNPGMPDGVADELIRFVEGGGRLLAFYSFSGKLRRVLGLTDGAHVKQEHPGSFASLRFADGALDGAPPVVRQQSWNISAFKPVPGVSRELAGWFDDKGRPTGHAALIGSSNGIVMTHVLLADDPANKSRLLMAMAGHLVPEIWKSAACGAIRTLGAECGFKSFDIAAARISALGGDAGAARAAHDAALAAIGESHYATAVEKAGEASQLLLRAWCAAQRPVPGEFRAFWCHSAFGVSGMDWNEAVARLATNGFTAIVPNMLWGGVAYYDSDVLPVAREVKDRGDQIAACVQACRRHGLQVHVWKVNWNLGHAAPREFVERMRREGRLQQDAKGDELDWLCPSHPENRKLEIAAMVEVARGYDVDGIHFDYIRYPGSSHCFCARCRAQVEKAAGAKIDDWPKAVLAKGALRQAWLQTRRDNITAVVQAVSEQARALKPGLRISAAVFPNWTTDRDGVGQDWKLWCDRGWLDFVCPMDYTPSTRKFEGMVTSQIEWAGKVPVYPGIGVSASSSRFGPDRVIEQIGITRKHDTGGFIIFNYGESESRDLVPLLGLGITKKP